ncbi:hypothetical protein [Myceligenerans crystallogenes]|uniref:Uncharacterized protein n=1 Tax=Myceligenerans crystallogenes TaxID=316335 RepID=A0ABN2NJA2_9MICO
MFSSSSYDEYKLRQAETDRRNERARHAAERKEAARPAPGSARDARREEHGRPAPRTATGWTTHPSRAA